jgi:murein DD-endopeptidase MepM/ murein hydrolase activator NlpD
MHALVKGALAAALVSTLSIFAPPEPRLRGAAAGLGASSDAELLMPCGPRMVPDGTSCVPIPGLDEPLGGTDAPAAARGSHPDRGQGTVVYDHLPRLPNRPEEADAYRYPVGAEGESVQILSGYDLDRDASGQRRIRDQDRGHHVGHGAIDIAAPRSAPVRAIELEGQQGPSEVVYIGPLFGTTVVTAHTLKQAQRLRVYLLFHGHLDGPAPGLVAGAKVTSGDVIGRVGDTGSPGNVHLHLEVRQVRPDVTLGELAAARWVDQAVSIPCDPRNVLPLR